MQCETFCNALYDILAMLVASQESIELFWFHGSHDLLVTCRVTHVVSRDGDVRSLLLAWRSA